MTSQLSGHQDNSGKNEATARFSLFHPLVIAKSLIMFDYENKSPKEKSKRTRADRIAKTSNNNDEINHKIGKV